MTTDSISHSDAYDESTASPHRVTTSEARDRLEDTLHSALRAAENTLIDAPTSLGKSHLMATTRWRDYPEITGGNPVIHVHQTKEARKDAVQKSRDTFGVEYHVLRGRTDACPVAAGDYDDELTAPNGRTPSEWFDWMCNVRNIPFQKAHRRLNQQYDLPCGEHCDAVTQWWDVQSDSEELEYDVLHVTANFAKVDELIDGANVIFDERPEYKLTFNDPERMQFTRATTNLLKHRSDGEFTEVDFKKAAIRDQTEEKEKIEQHFQDEVTQEWLFQREETHRLTPVIGRAVLDAEEILEGRYRGQDSGIEVVITDGGEIRHVQNTPDLSEARCVIGLDAFPSELRWSVNTVDNLTKRDVLSPSERTWWRRNERGLIIKQVGTATRSYTSRWKGAGEKRAKAIIQKIRELHGDDFQSCVTSDHVEDNIRQMMTAAGIEDPMTMHYGEQKSRNDYSDESSGAILASIDPGDENILDYLALCDAIAKPKRMVTEGGEISREVGREFVGPDADIARELLVSVRESNLAQAVGRYARDPDDPDSGAIVYVWSGAIPSILVDERIETTYHSMTKKRKQFLKVLKQFPKGCSAKTIADETGSYKSSVIDWLKEMKKRDNVLKSEGSGYQGADEWQWCGSVTENYVEFDQ
ncbi:hypothetical protein [Halorhabdus rudnickae]|uniref:hypothetical protein n=1 Tax=Halorhabdus rudnickae TaxID=1775544 RepID=UPI00108491D0|nr:hypothetical protein [Halorhabdus rudnickae]